MQQVAFFVGLSLGVCAGFGFGIVVSTFIPLLRDDRAEVKEDYLVEK